MPAIIALVILVGSVAGQGPSTETRQHRIIPIRAMSQDVEVLYGDPEAVGQPFVMRIRELAGRVIPPHKHPVDEHITVVQGTLFFGVGEKFDRAAMKELKAGGYAFIPAGSTMFGYTPDAAIVQVYGVGPFHIHWRAGNTWRDSLKSLDDADATSVFKFKKGEQVVAKRGRAASGRAMTRASSSATRSNARRQSVYGRGERIAAAAAMMPESRRSRDQAPTAAATSAS